MSDDFTPNMTLADARHLLVEKAWEHSLTCPTCSQTVGYRQRKITVGMKVALSLLATASGPESRWAHFLDVISPMQTKFHGVVDYSKLKYWGLVESLDEWDREARDAERAKGHSGTGLWRMTRLGWMFLTDRVRLPDAVIVFNDEVLRRSDVLKLWSETESRGFDWNSILLPSFDPPANLDVYGGEEQLALGL
jgi:hypothetical protein